MSEGFINTFELNCFYRIGSFPKGCLSDFRLGSNIKIDASTNKIGQLKLLLQCNCQGHLAIWPFDHVQCNTSFIATRDLVWIPA